MSKLTFAYQLRNHRLLELQGDYADDFLRRDLPYEKGLALLNLLEEAATTGYLPLDGIVALECGLYEWSICTDDGKPLYRASTPGYALRLMLDPSLRKRWGAPQLSKSFLCFQDL